MIARAAAAAAGPLAASPTISTRMASASAQNGLEVSVARARDTRASYTAGAAGFTVGARRVRHSERARVDRAAAAASRAVIAQSITVGR